MYYLQEGDESVKVIVRKIWGAWEGFTPSTQEDLIMWGLCLMTCVFLALGVVYDAEGVGGWFIAAAVLVLLLAFLSTMKE